jgi:hypothetical protein
MKPMNQLESKILIDQIAENIFGKVLDAALITDTDPLWLFDAVCKQLTRQNFANAVNSANERPS